MSRRCLILLLACSVLVAGCSGGRVRRVSDPAAVLQQVTVNADGSWKVELRLQNYSSMPMRYDTVDLQLQVAGQEAGTLRATPALSIGPESADVVTVPLKPASAARIAATDALIGRRTLDYTLKGSIKATPEESKQRSFQIDSRNTLSPAPGLPGVLR